MTMTAGSSALCKYCFLTKSLPVVFSVYFVTEVEIVFVILHPNID